VVAPGVVAPGQVADDPVANGQLGSDPAEPVAVAEDADAGEVAARG